jgi:hypothetical protein
MTGKKSTAKRKSSVSKKAQPKKSTTNEKKKNKNYTLISNQTMELNNLWEIYLDKMNRYINIIGYDMQKFIEMNENKTFNELLNENKTLQEITTLQLYKELYGWQFGDEIPSDNDKVEFLYDFMDNFLPAECERIIPAPNITLTFSDTKDTLELVEIPQLENKEVQDVIQLLKRYYNNYKNDLDEIEKIFSIIGKINDLTKSKKKIKIKDYLKLFKENTSIDLKKYITNLVPDTNDPNVINFWITKNDKKIYIEGWCDECLAGTGFPLMWEGGHERKLRYIEDLTPKIIDKKAKEKNLNLIEGGFIKTPNATHLYGITYGIYE